MNLGQLSTSVIITLEYVQGWNDVFLGLGVSQLAKSRRRPRQILHQELDEEFGLQFQGIMVEITVRQPMSLDE